MSQNDYEIATADANTGPTMRAAINAALQALASNNLGTGEPSATFAGMWWPDTTSGYMKQRNTANDGWLNKWKLTDGLLGPLGVAAGSSIQADQAVTTVASASSVALATTLEQYITDTNAIAEFTGTPGVRYRCRAAGALPLTHSADLSILQTGASVTLDAGATFDVYMVDANSCLVENIQLASGEALVAATGVTLGTPVASTSGTAIDFSSLPAGTKRVTVGLSGVSTSGTSSLIIQIGDSGGVETSGYLGATTNPGGTVLTNWSSGIIVDNAVLAADVLHAQVIMTLMDASTNKWCISSLVAGSDAAYLRFASGTKALSAVLDRVRITTAGGSDTFDAGSINVMYEV